MLVVVSPQRLCCPWRQILVTRGQNKASREAAADNTAAAKGKNSTDAPTRAGKEKKYTEHTQAQAKPNTIHTPTRTQENLQDDLRPELPMRSLLLGDFAMLCAAGFLSLPLLLAWLLLLFVLLLLPRGVLRCIVTSIISTVVAACICICWTLVITAVVVASVEVGDADGGREAGLLILLDLCFHSSGCCSLLIDPATCSRSG